LSKTTALWANGPTTNRIRPSEPWPAPC
jgi:hypothetical protein